MSTKCTIAHGTNFHFYEECFDPDRVYFRLEGAAATVELHVEDRRLVTVGIDIAIWRQIVEAWLKSYWGQHPEEDYDRTPPDFELLERFIKTLSKEKSE